MSSQISNKQINFPVKGTDSYFLNVVIGNGQTGTTTFKNFNNVQFSPDVLNAPVGKGSSIKGKSSTVVSVVIDVNPDTDNLIVTYYLTNAPKTGEELKNLIPIGISSMTVQTNSTGIFLTTLNFI
ncbi:hypothetical protein [Pedobacter sp. UBA5917]|jgi:hypothetical protein|uniref:hypothetical protein n=1 Tax=Pedobacter sp. UBA5917 TaxID=1947061 RepID=UPI0025CF72E7|nr:hypothetical protein [Pedobacter sp. UBA5917]